MDSLRGPHLIVGRPVYRATGCRVTTRADRRGATHVIVGESEPPDAGHMNFATGNHIDFFIAQLASLRHVRSPLLFKANRDVRSAAAPSPERSRRAVSEGTGHVPRQCRLDTHSRQSQRTSPEWLNFLTDISALRMAEFFRRTIRVVAADWNWPFAAEPRLSATELIADLALYQQKVLRAGRARSAFNVMRQLRRKSRYPVSGPQPDWRRWPGEGCR